MITKMAATYGAAVFLGVGKCCPSPAGILAPYLKSNVIVPLRNYAARKGTREKAKKKKIKVEQKKIEFVPHNLRKEVEAPTTSRRLNDDKKAVSPDNVWISRYYRWKLYSFAEAVKCHRETLHPTMYNVPNAPLNVFIELDMHAEKKNRFMDNFTKVVAIPHPFDHGETRTIAFFSKSEEDHKVALEAGATLAGSTELIQNIQRGDIALQDFNYFIAHPNILAELVSIRGLLKRRFPNAPSGTLGVNVAEMVNRYHCGIKYTAVKDQYEQDYGVIETSVGPLSMEDAHLEANFAALLKDVHNSRARKNFPFITRVLFLAPPSAERLKVDFSPYVEQLSPPEKRSEEQEGTRVEEKVVAATA